jgi:hypothetical protein
MTGAICPLHDATRLTFTAHTHSAAFFEIFSASL